MHDSLVECLPSDAVAAAVKGGDQLSVVQKGVHVLLCLLNRRGVFFFFFFFLQSYFSTHILQVLEMNACLPDCNPVLPKVIQEVAEFP